MENIHVILCGTDAFQVEGVLQGVAEKAHPAWSKKYRFSCTNALSVDRVDSRLLLVCHIIVLCKGCRAPKDKATYGGRPVLSLPDATPTCVEEVRDSEYYYGPTTLAELRGAVLSIALSPCHVVFDSLLQCFTPVGEAAFLRAFWLLDRSNDGVLDRDELLAWTRLTRSADFTEADLGEFVATVEAVTGPCPDLSFTQEQFNTLHHHWLEAGNVEDAWATLHALGTHPDGKPFSWYDLHSLRVDRDVNTYLSPHAIQFLRNVYKLKDFKNASAGGIWRVTPGCPWAHVDGFSSAASIPLDRFIEYWKYMALERRETVIMYARYWGYKGDAGFLFVLRSVRTARRPEEPLPNTIQVLVVGTESCGRKSLVFQLTADGKETFAPHSDAALYVRAVTILADKAGGRGGTLEEPQTIVYTTIGADKAEVILTNESLNRTFDAVLLCVDGGDYEASAGYIMGLYERVQAAGNCPSMPSVLVVTKSDMLEDDTASACTSTRATPPVASVTTGTRRLPSALLSYLGTHTERSTTTTLMEFAQTWRLLWPPVMTSALRPEESEIAVLNEYMYAVARDPELAVGKAPLTWVKLLRRSTFVAIVAVGTVGLLQKLGQWALSRRKK